MYHKHVPAFVQFTAIRQTETARTPVAHITFYGPVPCAISPRHGRDTQLRNILDIL